MGHKHPLVFIDDIAPPRDEHSCMLLGCGDLDLKAVGDQVVVAA
jgi:hypothetical protein